MCLAIPALVVEVLSDERAKVDFGGVRMDVSIALLEERVDAGDYVIVHVGYVLKKLDTKKADETIREIAEAAGTSNGDERASSRKHFSGSTSSVSLH